MYTRYKMSRKWIVVDHLTWMEMNYLKKILDARSMDGVIRMCHKVMRQYAIDRHKAVGELEYELLTRQYGGHVPIEDILPESPVE